MTICRCDVFINDQPVGGLLEIDGPLFERIIAVYEEHGIRRNVHAPNRLQQQFTVTRPNETWVSGITHIRTHEGWLYLAVILDLFSRRVIGWSLQARINKELVLDALLMAAWRRKPASTVTVHTDQGSQYTSFDGRTF